MSKILFVTDSYGWKATANGICVAQIAEYYRDMNYDVHVLCFQRKGESKMELTSGITIHRIQMNMIARLSAIYELYDCSRIKKALALFAHKWLNRLQSMMFLYWFPMHTPLFTYRYFKEISRLHRHYKFDSVISSYCPFEAAGGTYLFKKQYPETFACLYILDSLSNLIPKFFLTKEWQDKKGWQWERRFYQVYDLILHMQCHDRHYAQSRYDIFRSKMKAADIPHISRNLLSGRHVCLKKKDDELKFLYAGLMQKITGNYTMKLFSLLAREQPFVLDIYTRSPLESVKADISTELKSMLCWNGFVPREDVLSAECSADILISMGNPQSDFITSKIFEFMMTGHKILHFYNRGKDPAISYLKKYPNTCLIDVRLPVAENMDKLKVFINKDTVCVDTDWLFHTFTKNTPKYTYDLIEAGRQGGD